MTAQAFNRAMGAAIKRHRLARGLKQADIGAALGVSYQQIQKNEHGINALSAYQVSNLAVVFGLPVGTLYADAELTQPEHAPTAAENDSFLAARYIAKIRSPQQRSALIDYTRKLAYEGASA
jgi:transcriptional regulator with XRE-family HTH domain